MTQSQNCWPAEKPSEGKATAETKKMCAKIRSLPRAADHCEKSGPGHKWKNLQVPFGRSVAPAHHGKHSNDCEDGSGKPNEEMVAAMECDIDVVGDCRSK